MRFLAMTGLVGMLAWSSTTLLHGGDQAANEPAVLSVRGSRSARAERMKPVEAGRTTVQRVGVPALLPGGVVLVSDDRLTESQLESPLDWPSDIADDTTDSTYQQTPGRFEPAPSLSVVEPPAAEPSGRSILTARPLPTEAPSTEANSLRVAQRPHRAATPRATTESAPAQQWRSSTAETPAEATSPSSDESIPEPAPGASFAPQSHDPLADFGVEASPSMASDEASDASPTEIHSGAAALSERPSLEPTAGDPPAEPEADADFAFLNDEAPTEPAPAAAATESPAQLPTTDESTFSDEAVSHDSEPFAPQGGAAEPQAGSDELACRWVVPEQLNLGEQATCRMVVCNGGSTTAHAVLVRIELPKNVRLVNADPAPNAAGQALTWKFAQLEPGQNHEVLLTVVPTAEGNVNPTAMVTCTRASQASISIRKPNLEIKVEGGERLSLGQPATYQLVVHNTGSGAAANVQLAARFSAGLHHPQGQQVRYRVGTLSAGETRQVQLPLTGLRPGACEIEVLVATGDKLAAEIKRSIEVVKPTLQVALSGPKLRYVDRKATYMLKVHNPGPAPADNVQLLEQLPDGMRFLEASPGGSFDPNLKQVAWFVGRLEPQQSAEVGVHVVAESAGDHTLAAVAKADSGVTAKVKTMTKVEGVSLVVLDVVDRDDPIEAGSETSYEIRVTNRGSEPAHQVQVAARLPESMSALKASGPTAGTVDGQQVVFEPLGSLAPGESQAFVVSVRCLKAGAARFQAYFRSQEEPKALLQEETTRIYGE